MARTTTITFGQIAAIADAMKAAGTRPTARAIRERIGSGSMGTIHRLLQQWQGKASEQDEETEAAELPSHIQSALMDFIGTEIATACEPINEELQAAKEAADQIAEDNERMHRAFDEQGRELVAMIEKLATTAANLAQTRSILADHESECIKLREQVSGLLLDLDRSQRQTEMLASYAPELAQAKQVIGELSEKAATAEKAAAVFSAQLDAKTEAADEMAKRLQQAETRASTATEEAKQANNHYQACAARLESAAREIESLRRPKPAAKPKTSPTPKKPNGNS